MPRCGLTPTCGIRAGIPGADLFSLTTFEPRSITRLHTNVGGLQNRSTVFTRYYIAGVLTFLPGELPTNPPALEASKFQVKLFLCLLPTFVSLL